MKASAMAADVATWFGSSGIRGPYPSHVDAALALRLGLATAPLARRILLGHDPRLSSPLLTEAFLSGALSAGALVDVAGPAATPSLAYGARDYDAAVAITASHNPAPDNGFKFWNPDGSAWLPDQEDRLEQGLEGSAVRAPWQTLQPRMFRPGVTRRHQEAILRFAGPVEGEVVLDCGNGAGAFVSPGLFREAGLRTTVLHETPDGTFPSRPSEPTPENLSILMAECKRHRRWGIAHDGDADRMVPVGPEGAVVPSERVIVALALHVGAKRIATPVDASLALVKALPGVRWDYTKVGDAHVSAAVRTHGAGLGAETSGTYIVPGFDFAPDGPLAAILFLQAAGNGIVDEAARRVAGVHRRSEKVPLGHVSREELRTRLETVDARADEEATRVDGLRIDGPQGWFLLRPSGTEPVARITAEGWTSADADALLDEGRRRLRPILA